MKAIMPDIDHTQPEFTLTLKFLTDEQKNIKFSHDFFQRTVKEFKNVFFPDEILANKTIKLIYKGRLLEDSSFLSNYSLIDKDVLHVLIANNNLSTLTNNPINSGNENPPAVIENAANNYNNDFFLQIIRQGFDKFSNESFLEEDIENLREIHHVGYQIDKYSLSRSQMTEKEEGLMRTSPLLLRNQLQSIKEERLKKDRGTYMHFIVGAILGYFFNVLILLLMVFFKSPKNAMLGTLLGFLLKIAVISFQNVNRTAI